MHNVLAHQLQGYHQSLQLPLTAWMRRKLERIRILQNVRFFFHMAHFFYVGFTYIFRGSRCYISSISSVFHLTFDLRKITNILNITALSGLTDYCFQHIPLTWNRNPHSTANMSIELTNTQGLDIDPDIHLIRVKWTEAEFIAPWKRNGHQ